jgi:hypothetical protein
MRRQEGAIRPDKTMIVAKPQSGPPKLVLQRALSLPERLDDARPSRKLFWFRPDQKIASSEEARDDFPAERNHSRSTVRLLGSCDSSLDDESGHTEDLSEHDEELLIGLSFLDDEELRGN